MSSSALPDHVGYVHCNFCNTTLVVSVPRINLSTIVTVRCGHCANLLSVNMGVLSQPILPPHLQKLQSHNLGPQCSHLECDQKEEPLANAPEKKQRVPSAYNRFIKEEIRRLKATNPNISHKEAFSTAAKNWAHFPNIHFGMNLDGSKQAKMDDAF
ncbi:hypothetical protein HPP92_026056 [Vanilla planifolia]|uniref:YABBY transcription factor n=1 Tax=Vanilla planifolia TaxID=51239 RepID=A0A835PDF9_VANPL|nr:hypothetical protein HPP92_026329 [Vanilla planifolia]KAG0451798.1 hypothetical protein HPP92_026056 [Vanilla planifolia]